MFVSVLFFKIICLPGYLSGLMKKSKTKVKQKDLRIMINKHVRQDHHENNAPKDNHAKRVKIMQEWRTTNKPSYSIHDTIWIASRKLECKFLTVLCY